jgi:tRNA pseudouridine55 synthase
LSCALIGLLLLDKPVGMSSNAALQRVRRLGHGVKAGHCGSLDPLASGMLPGTPKGRSSSAARCRR